MPPNPASRPDVSPPLSSAASGPRVRPEDVSQTDLAALAARFAAPGGGGLSPDLSFDLALEIVLNEIVEQACLATGATGAAIVLRRGTEMVCRATCGATAPTLGSTVDTSSGLSGLCVKTLCTQRSDDAATDPRADAEASLRLGVRSVMVMPLLRGEELLGVFELFSSRPAAFGDRDELTLEALASRALANVERAARPMPAADPAPGVASDSDGEIAAKDDANPGRRGLDFITLVLAVAVLACAVLFGGLVGRHFAAQKTRAPLHTVPAAPTVSAPMASTPAEENSAKTGSPEKASAQPAPAKPRVKNAVPTGSLTIYENGKEIFRMPSAPVESGTADRELGVQRAATLEKEESGQETRGNRAPLLYRVEPAYPEEARQQGIQGTVVLDVRIGVDGTVDSVQVVSGPPQLMQAAAEAVTRWRFQPRTENGQPVRMQTRVTLNFRLPGG
jgi:TonB family protein